MKKSDAQITYGALAILGAFAAALAMNANHPDLILLCGVSAGYCIGRATS